MRSVALLHAFPCDHTMWDAQVRALRDQGWQATAVDLPGFGSAPLPSGPPTMAALAETVRAGLADRGFTQGVVIGLSVGGYVSMEMLRQQPDMITDLVLVDTKASADPISAQQSREDLASQVERHPQQVGDILSAALSDKLLGPTTRAERPEVCAQVERWMYAAAPETVAWYQRAMAARPDSLRTLAGLQIPVHVVWGVEDVLSGRADQDAMLAAVPHATFTEIPAAGHLSAVEQPDLVSQALVQRLALPPA
jgi:pimeloyl-ACP methyl ester carboxylesterase